MASRQLSITSNYLATFWSGFASFIFIPQYISLLGLEQFALVSLFILFQSWLPLLDFGIGQTLTREISIYQSRGTSLSSVCQLIRSSEYLSFFISLIFLVGFLLLSPSINSIILKPDTSLAPSNVLLALQLMGVSLFLRFLESVYRNVLLGGQFYLQSSSIQFIRSTLTSIIVVPVLYFFGANLIVFFIWQLFVSLFTLVVSLVSVYRLFSIPILRNQASLQSISHLRHFASSLALINIFALLLVQFDKILIFQLLSLDDFAIYSTAASVASSLTLFLSPLSSFFYPIYCTDYGSRDFRSLTSNFHLSAQLISVLACTSCLSIFFFANPLLSVWLNNTSVSIPALPVLQVLAIAILINTFVTPIYQLLLALGVTTLTLYMTVIFCFLFFPIGYISISSLGTLGAAYSFLSMNIMAFIVLASGTFTRHLSSAFSSWIIYDICLPFFSALLFLILVAKPLFSYFISLDLNPFFAFILISPFTLLCTACSAPRIRLIISRLISNA
ncbi:oligosaccharide flippase family protein [Synechococcus sp. MIT S9452]|uniref:oligosaccharide flippase family protein n=1 Tax=Synechococcus sp. MIT S9452 TaxID=3082546 RepID=UPI0039A61A9F